MRNEQNKNKNKHKKIYKQTKNIWKKCENKKHTIVTVPKSNTIIIVREPFWFN